MTAVFPDLRPAFPHTAEFVINGHTTLHDVDFQPWCGYVSVEEAWLLWQTAQAFPGIWVEIGAHTGWSAAHLASGGVEVYALDPSFKDAAFRERAVQNWTRARVRHLIRDVPSASGDWLPGVGHRIEGAFVDGDHDAPAPLNDAKLLLPLLAPRAAVAFHDCMGAPVEEAVAWLAGQGFHVRTYPTMSRLTVCWRGDWTPPELQR